MQVDQLIDTLVGDDDLMSFVGSLGRDCLARRRAVTQDQYAAQADKILTLRASATEESKKMWDSDGKRCARPSAEFTKQMAEVGQVTPELATITVLEGICSGAARIFFAKASSVVGVERGSVLPLPERWLPNIPTTPNPATMHPNLLDEGCNFVLWELDWVVELDYTFRDRLDLVCAVALTDDQFDGKRSKGKVAYALPKIATVHPFRGADMGGPEEWDQDRRRFFRVRPKLPSDDATKSQADDASNADADDRSRAQAHQQVFDALAKAGDVAPIAVLPEFCLHFPDALDALIAQSDRALAELIVAGSAHTVDETGERANRSHVFLDKYPILRVSKREPFVLRSGDARGNPINYTEDIDPSPDVLRLAAGTATRLGIAICSDLNSSRLVAAMTWAGVNLLLSPSWTPKIGGADKGLECLAGYCQCLGVIANTPEHVLAKPQPNDTSFWVCSAVPREKDHAHFHDNADATLPAAGVLDPNLPPTQTGYWTWLP